MLPRPCFCAGLSEVALSVEDVAASVRFYTEVVGLVPEVVEESYAFLWAGEPGRQQRIILLNRAFKPLGQREESGAVLPETAGPVTITALSPADFGLTHCALFVPREGLG